MGDRAVCFDLDGTLRGSMQRRHLVPASFGSPHDPGGTVMKDWEAYDKAGLHDEPQPGPVACMRFFYESGVQVHVVSGSGYHARAEARKWLDAYAPFYHRLRLRLPEEDGIPSGVLKATYVLGLQAQGIEVISFWEDWAQGAKTITEMTGVPCVVVNPCYDGVCTCGGMPARA